MREGGKARDKCERFQSSNVKSPRADELVHVAFFALSRFFSDSAQLPADGAAPTAASGVLSCSASQVRDGIFSLSSLSRVNFQRVRK